MKSRIPKTPLLHVLQEREGMSPRHLANVRKLDCLGCGSEAAAGYGNMTAHHLLRTGEHGTGFKSADKWAVPLCIKCHLPHFNGSVHHGGDEDAWFAARDIDARAVARSLWAHRSNLEAMRRVIFRARQMSELTKKRRAILKQETRT